MVEIGKSGSMSGIENAVTSNHKAPPDEKGRKHGSGPLYDPPSIRDDRSRGEAT
jgi:hypothetical protein